MRSRRLKFYLPTLVICAAAALGSAQAVAQHSVEDGLTVEMNQIIAAHHGKVALYARQLNSQHEVEIDSTKPVQTASDIKLAILYYAMVEVREGRAKWDERLTLKPGEAVGGSGMLHFFDTPLSLTLKDVLTMMVVVSDNTATNMAIDRFGIDAINARAESVGLVNTHLYKKVFKPAEGPLPADYATFGLGKSTPREMADLIEDIGACRLHHLGSMHGAQMWLPMDEQDKAVCDVALGMLKNQFYRETVPRYLESADVTTTGGVAIASKTGSLDAVRADVAIVMGKTGPMVISIFTYDNVDHGWTVDNEGELTIAKLAKAIVTAWSPGGLDGKLLVPGLGLADGAIGSAAAKK
jgi:beta-lactamase class A